MPVFPTTSPYVVSVGGTDSNFKAHNVVVGPALPPTFALGLVRTAFYLYKRMLHERWDANLTPGASNKSPNIASSRLIFPSRIDAPLDPPPADEHKYVFGPNTAWIPFGKGKQVPLGPTYDISLSTTPGSLLGHHRGQNSQLLLGVF